MRFAYTVAELEGWKATQQASAGAGTPLTDSDVRSYARLTEREQGIILDIARRVERVTSACRVAQGGVDGVRARQEQARRRLITEQGPMWENHDGTMVEVGHRTQLAPMEVRQWDAQAREAVRAEIPRVREALAGLGEELAVLRMISPSLAPQVDLIQDCLTPLLHALTTLSRVEDVADRLTAMVATLWRVAIGESDGAG